MPAPLPESALNCAAVLAWTAHVDHLRSKFDGIAEDSASSMEKTCWAEEMSIGTRVIRNYAMRSLADHYSSQESISVPNSASKLFLGLSSRTEVDSASDVSSSSIEQLLDGLDQPPKEGNALVQDPIVFEKLYKTLKNAVSKFVDINTTSETNFDTILSKLLADYLGTQKSILDGANEFKGFAAETTTYLRGDSPAPCNWDDVFSVFKLLLNFHVDISSVSPFSNETRQITVSKLRENGNNLMSNTCYPQAIQVYTDAIHLCNHETITHLPQLFTNRAIAFIGLNCFREAVNDLVKAIKQDRTFVPAWTQMGYCQLYLGFTMNSIKCYLAALRCIAGEIYPYNFPADESLRNEYTYVKASTVMPQFVQKLVQSMLLAVRRAEQQRESSSVINDHTVRVRAILARLRAQVQDEDWHFLAYSPDPEASSLQSAAMRADTVRPSILTPDVAQDILASTNVEASAVTMNNIPEARTDMPIPIVPLAAGRLVTTERDAAQPIATQPGGGGVTSNIRGFLNTLGNVVGEAMQPFPATGGPRHPGTISSSSREVGPPSAENNGSVPSQPNNHMTSALASVRQAIRMAQQNSAAEGSTPNPSMLEALRHQQAAIERMLTSTAPNSNPNSTSHGFPEGTIVHRETRSSVNGDISPSVTTTRIVRSGPQSSATSNQAAPITRNTPRQESIDISRRSPGAEDTEMPDAPDVD